MEIISILRALRSKMWILIVFPLVSVVCAILLVSRLDKVYKSTAQISTGFTSDEAVHLSEERTSSQFEVSTRFINTIESMKSIPVMSLVSYRLILHDLKSDKPFRGIKDADDHEFTLDDPTRKRLIDLFQKKLDSVEVLSSFNDEDQLAFSVLGAYKYDYDHLSDQFSIYRRSLSDFIAVDFASEEPLLSAFAVNALCQEFIRFNKTLKTDRSSESIEFLEKLVEEKRIARDKRVNELSEFKVVNNIYNYSAESANKITQISTYEANREIEIKNIAALTLSLTTVTSKINSLTLIDQQEVAKVNQRIIDLRKRISELTGSQDEASKLRASQLRDELQLEISRLENMNNSNDMGEYTTLTKERDRLQLELQIGQANLQTLEQTLGRLKSTITGFAAKEARLAELERDLQVISTEYQTAQERYNAAINKASVIGSSIRQIIQGQPSSQPESSKEILLVALAGIGSFILCAVAILLVEVSNFSIRTQGRLERMTGLKNIATLNQIDLNINDLPKVFNSKNKDENVDVFVHFLRKFRFEIQNSDKQMILVTSTKPQTGKSFIIVNLAYALSLLNKRILIVDTNFKSSSLTKMLIPHANVQGLLKKGNSEITLLVQNTKEDTETETKKTSNNGKSIIYETPFKGVDIIGNFGGKDSPSEILAGKDFRRMLDNLMVQYDYVLLEGPSLNDYSDTRELIQYVDTIIPVFDARTTLTNLDYDSIKYLKGIKSKVLGTVLNNAKYSDLAV
jgi:succinoglycan biosynthesis transport protein ExoP